MPDDQTLATILAICDLMGNRNANATAAIAAYERAMSEVLRYRKEAGLTEVGGYPQK
jgi:hypothetical protein